MEQSIKTEKRALRKRILGLRDSLSSNELQEAEEELCRTLLRHPYVQEAERVLAYVSFGSEPGTWRFLEEVLKQGRQLFVPKIIGEDMFFVRIFSLSELEPGYKGIPEPVGLGVQYLYEPKTAEKDFLLMPGVGFDEEGHRMGYGKGFYDRFLRDKPLLVKRSIAVCHRCQLVDSIPFEEHDVKPAIVFAICNDSEPCKSATN